MAAQELPSYYFRFSCVAESLREEVPGAMHATELPFVFNTIDARYGDAVRTADAATAQAANRYWVSVAKTGDPKGPGLPRWAA